MAISSHFSGLQRIYELYEIVLTRFSWTIALKLKKCLIIIKVKKVNWWNDFTPLSSGALVRGKIYFLTWILLKKSGFRYFSACKRKDDSPDHHQQPKKPRLVFTDLQRRTLQAIFKVSRDKKTILTYKNCASAETQTLKPILTLFTYIRYFISLKAVKRFF